MAAAGLNFFLKKMRVQKCRLPSAPTVLRAATDSWRMEVHMNNLFFASWKSSGGEAERREDFWLHPPPSGFGRLLTAIAIIAVAACLLNHAAGKGPADTLITSTYGSSQQGR
jgi:hypothetical protein